MEFDKTLKPTGKLIDVSDRNHQFSFLEYRPISSTVFDNCLTDLQKNEEGIARTTLKYNNKTITVWQEVKSFPYLQVYSYDFSDKGNKRKGFAIEAESCCGYAFNQDNLGLLELAPGEEYSGRWGVEFEF